MKKRDYIYASCKDCKYYYYTPNILGGVAECMKDVKMLRVFHDNEACPKFKPRGGKEER